MPETDDVRPTLGDAPTPFDRAAVVIPGYDLLEEVGWLGGGVMYRAVCRSLGREVAVKVCPDRHPAVSPAARRFVDGAGTLARLQHPGVPAVHALGELPDGRPFLVMRLFRGKPLGRLLAGRADPAADRGRLIAAFERACQAIAFAHARGVVHGRLDVNQIVVGEFGEVQVVGWVPAGAGSSADGAGDARDDVYALGAVLFDILTGRPPVGSADPEIGPGADGGDPGLTDLCRRCLAADPADRPPDARAVADDVAAYRARAEAQARWAHLDRSRARREREAAAKADAVTRRRRRRTASVAAGAALVAALTAGWQAGRRSVKTAGRGVAPTAGALAVAAPTPSDRLEAGTAADSAAGLDWGAMSRTAHRLAEVVAAGRETATARGRNLVNDAVRWWDESIERTALGDRKPSHAARQPAGTTDTKPADSDTVERQHRPADAHPPALADTAERVRALLAHGVALYEAGKPADAEREFREAADVAARLAATHPGVVEYRHRWASAVVNLAIARKDQGDHAATRAMLAQARPRHAGLIADDPANRDYQRIFRNHLVTECGAAAGQGDHAAVAAAAADLARVGFDPAGDGYLAASFMAWSAGAAVRDDRLAPADRAALADRRAVEAVALLRRAADGGFRDVSRLREDGAFAAVRGRAEFAELVAGLEIRPERLPHPRAAGR